MIDGFISAPRQGSLLKSKTLAYFNKFALFFDAGGGNELSQCELLPQKTWTSPCISVALRTEMIKEAALRRLPVLLALFH